jgi:hypothetical protein
VDAAKTTASKNLAWESGVLAFDLAQSLVERALAALGQSEEEFPESETPPDYDDDLTVATCPTDEFSERFTIRSKESTIAIKTPVLPYALEVYANEDYYDEYSFILDRIGYLDAADYAPGLHLFGNPSAASRCCHDKVNSETRYKTVFQNAPSAGLPNQLSPNLLHTPHYDTQHESKEPDASPIDIPQVLNELYGKALDFSVESWSTYDPNSYEETKYEIDSQTGELLITEPNTNVSSLETANTNNQTNLSEPDSNEVLNSTETNTPIMGADTDATSIVSSNVELASAATANSASESSNTSNSNAGSYTIWDENEILTLIKDFDGAFGSFLTSRMSIVSAPEVGWLKSWVSNGAWKEIEWVTGSYNYHLKCVTFHIPKNWTSEQAATYILDDSANGTWVGETTIFNAYIHWMNNIRPGKADYVKEYQAQYKQALKGAAEMAKQYVEFLASTNPGATLTLIFHNVMEKNYWDAAFDLISLIPIDRVFGKIHIKLPDLGASVEMSEDVVKYINKLKKVDKEGLLAVLKNAKNIKEVESTLGKVGKAAKTTVSTAEKGKAALKIAEKVVTKTVGALPEGFDLENGFASFDAFKAAYGAAGDNRAWHHIVEQTINKGKFSAELLHNPANLVNLPHGTGSIHSKISAFYSSKPDFAKGLTVREWLSKKSFKEQYEYGINKIKELGGSKYLPEHLR